MSIATELCLTVPYQIHRLLIYQGLGISLLNPPGAQERVPVPVRKVSYSFPLAPHWALFPYGAASGEMCLAIPIFPAEVPISS